MASTPTISTTLQRSNHRSRNAPSCSCVDSTPGSDATFGIKYYQTIGFIEAFNVASTFGFNWFAGPPISIQSSPPISPPCSIQPLISTQHSVSIQHPTIGLDPTMGFNAQPPNRYPVASTPTTISTKPSISIKRSVSIQSSLPTFSIIIPTIGFNEAFSPAPAFFGFDS
jgi:hypothetical protein